MTRLPEKARSECVAPSVLPCGGDVESIRMFHAACSASQRPALRFGRGSGVGAVPDTTGVTGFGNSAGGGGGGGGGGGAGAAAGAGGVAGTCCALTCVDTQIPTATVRPATSRLLIGNAVPLFIACPPAFSACERSRSIDRRTRPMQTCRSVRPAPRHTT